MYEVPSGHAAKYADGTPEAALVEHLDNEGFGGWVNTEEVVEEVLKMGWRPPTKDKDWPVYDR